MERRVVLVTGGTRGIGYAIARIFAESGYDVAFHGLGTPEEIEEQKALLRGNGVKVEYFAGDLLQGEEALGLVGRVEADFGKVDVLVNNAGMQYVAAFEDHELEMWDKVIAVNLTASFCTMKMAIGGMVSRGWGRILNIASVHGKVGSVHKASYVTSKHGMLGLTRVAALELAGSGVTCNAICPGWVSTPLVWAQVKKRSEERGVSLDEARESLVKEKQPSGTMLEPEEVAKLSLFLCSDEAKHFQGSALSIDGGWSAQ
jgi:3-hydroxybutyrate dehydrogenase